jgi:hypothetical protein
VPHPYGEDRVEQRPDGRVRLSAPRPKGWAPRRPAGPGLALHPGTAIQWEDGIWEVLSAEETGGAVRYELAPWDDRHAIRLLLPYDEASEAGRAAGARDVGRRRAAGGAALLLAPLVGLLPGRVQEKLELELGVRATTLTLASLLAPTAAGTYAMLVTAASGFGAGLQLGGPAAGPLLPLVGFLLPESLLRFVVVFAQDRPIGSVLGLPLYLLARATGLVGPAPAPPGPGPTPAARVPGDRYLLIEPLLSFLPVADQQHLRERFGFSPVTWGKRTAWFLLFYPGLTAPAHAARLLALGGGLRSFLLLAFALALGVEQVVRLRKLARGEPAPSLLGRLVAPFAAPLLR